MRETRAQDAVITRYACSLISFKARQLARRPGFSRSDQEDLEQELWTMLLAQSHQFDPDRASFNTFSDRVVNTSVRMILRDRRRQKRADGLRAQSLDGTPAGECSESMGAQISEADHCRRNGTEPSDEQLRREDREAIDCACSAMPEEVRDVCRRVMGGSITSAARELGTSRRQIRNALAEAQPWMERAGFSKS